MAPIIPKTMKAFSSIWKKSGPDLKYATITTVSQKDIHKLLAENKGKADYIICVDEDMTATY